MRVIEVPCLKDNYAYLIHADGSDQALVVDPSEAEPVLAAVERAGLRLVGILTTHHHWDHVGGNEALIRHYGELPVYGHVSERERIPGFAVGLEHAESFRAAGLSLSVLHVPGHTLGALAYLVEDAVFTGDTLFAAGCGRLFEGTPAMMYESLNEKLGKLPGATRVFFGHEYTQANLRFATHVEPGNTAAQQRAAQVAELRERGRPTTPSTIAEELATNPFMRCDSVEIRSSVRARLEGDPTPATVLGAVRAEKDAFK